MSDLKRWLESLGLERYEVVFASNDIDLTVVSELTEHDLQTLGLSLGHRRKLMAAAAKLRGGSAGSPDPAPRLDGAAARAPAERRQLTVLFIDLVGSTELGSILDPEDLVVLLRQFRETCVTTIAKHEGYIAQYLGDGILVYFGFPQAQEDAAERAVRAGLDVVEKIGRLERPDGSPLHSRVGIATGLVVVGDRAGVGVAGEETVVGDTPNLAARLQSLAEADCVLVAQTTHRLTAGLFEFGYRGDHIIKGFPARIPVWKAIRETPADSRFGAAHVTSTGPIVGRDREQAFLNDAWLRATQGSGHMVLLEGDAGIGKSRLVEAFADRIREAPYALLWMQCSPYHRNSALFPFRTLLRQRLDLDLSASATEHVERISWLLGEVGRLDRASTLLLAELLEVRTDDLLPPDAMTPNQRRDETLAILADLMLSTRAGPVLLVLEDAQWSDQTSQALVDRLVQRVARERALVVITCRPELKPAWSRHPDATVIACKQITREQCIEVIERIANGASIAASAVEQIITRSDGVPLFVEELTKAVLDSHSTGGGTVPLTLRDSLMSRLDRLGAAKEIAQVASVFGREFTFETLQAVADTDERALRDALSRLHDAGLVFESGHGAGAMLSFNHSLVQEAAYDSLSRSRRQSLHGRIARHFDDRASATAGRDPAVIAHHYSRAGEPDQSARCWLEAAEDSRRRVALSESIANLGAALDEAERVPAPEVRQQLRLDAQLKLGAALAIQKGPQSDEAEAALERAEKLAREAGAGAQLFQATWGLYLHAARNGRFGQSKVHGDELVRISDELGDDDLKYEALHHRWGNAYFTGQTSDMLVFTAKGVADYDRERHHRLSDVFAGHDPGVCAHCVRALALGVAGDARQVRVELESGLALAHELHHPLTLAFLHSVACFAMHIVLDTGASSSFAQQLMLVSAKYDLAATHAVGSFMSGAARGLEGEVPAALEQMEPAFEATLAYGFMGVLPGVIMADMLARAGRHREATTLATRLIDNLTTETAVFIPELWRLRGELALQQAPRETDRALRDFQTALRIAQVQGAPVYQLRAATAAARLLAETNQLDRAREALEQAGANQLMDWTGPELAIAAQLRSQLA